jgi:hypothetical protein
MSQRDFQRRITASVELVKKTHDRNRAQAL